MGVCPWVSKSPWVAAEVSFPYVPGFDLAGTVAKLGEDVSDLAVGDEAAPGNLEVLTTTIELFVISFYVCLEL